MTCVDGVAHQRVDQCGLAGADLAEDDDLDAACFELLDHVVELLEISLERGALFVAAAAELIDGVADGGDGGFVVGIARRGGRRWALPEPLRPAA